MVSKKRESQNKIMFAHQTHKNTYNSVATFNNMD